MRVLTRDAQRMAAFMETLVDRTLVPAAKATGTIPNALGRSGISMISARDVGHCAAAALTDSRWDGRTRRLIGPHLGRVVEVAETTPAALRESLVARGVETWEAEHFKEMYELFRDGHSEFVTGDVRRLLGRDPVDLAAHLGPAGDLGTHP
ncbi:hypothetical protein [Lentzea sp. NPDC060358]|uniref:hypothetical protein n=1 Tax=Lentzea sp. NPDC060358 TaxID=3347103 RepID=UPI003663735C